METTNMNVRVDADLKRRAEEIYKELGMNLSTAVNIFLRQSVRYGGIPFELRLERPNPETIAAIQEVERGESLSGPFRDTKSLMEALNNAEAE
ncbi:MAG: type II toxin-antitoxin system RelB/DinJ family antitoxin [Clostridia bacterium]|nr:type II toxin-antitoxin system RelB/DinJ family antitoxin [Clostridia bacterium]